MIALKGKDYYLALIYPMLYAAGGVFWEKLTEQRPRLRWLRVALPAVVFMPDLVPYRWFSRFFRQPGLFPTWKGSTSSQLRRKPRCEAFCRNTSRTNSMARDGRDRGRRL
jgi:hypothetical protein